VVGTVEEYPNSEAVRVASKGLIDKPNPAVQLMKPLEMTIGELCQHFRHRELARDDNWRSYSTRKELLVPAEALDHPPLGKSWAR
jgi:hypothetical protein